jgi:hypothetical protein
MTLYRTAIVMCGTSSVQYERVNGGCCLVVVPSCKRFVHTQIVVANLIGLSEMGPLSNCVSGRPWCPVSVYSDC